MPRRFVQSPLSAEVERFESAVARIALEIVRAVLSDEAGRRHAQAVQAGRQARERRPRRRLGQPEGRVPVNTAGAAVLDRAPSPAADVPRPAAPATPRASGGAHQAPSRSPRSWTREAVVAELGKYLLAGRPVEAAFLKRHGPPGLVSSAKRLFGRFDAALNAANLALSEQIRATHRTERQAAKCYEARLLMGIDAA